MGSGSKFQRVRQFGRDESGSVLVETTVVMPMFMLLVFGLVTLGFVFNNYVTLNSVTWAGARAVAVDTPTLVGGVPSTTFTPYTDLQNTLKTQQQNGQVFNGWLSVFNSSPTATGGVTITSVCVYPANSTCASGGTTCTSDSACNKALESGVTSNGVVTVQTSYPCLIAFKMFGLTSCTLTASATVQVQ